jgi:integrase
MGNVLKLTWAQVNLFKREIIIGETKNGEPIGLPVCEILFKTLKSLNKFRDIQSKNVFPSKLSYNALQRRVERAFKIACNASGIEDFRWHDFASMFIQRGVDIYTVQILLGHKGGRMTKRYAHLSTKNLKSATSVLDKPDFDYNMTTVGNLEESGSCNALS